MDATDSVHDLSGFWPNVHLAPGLDLPTYYLVISVTACISVLWLVRRAEARGLKRNLALDIAMVLMISGFVGARLFHVFFEEPAYYLEAPTRVLEFWMGGFVWYGGALLAAVCGIAYARRKLLPLGTWLDLFAPVVALAYALGRVACLLTGCCYGDVCVLPTMLASGFRFRHPTQAYAILWELAVLVVLLRLEKRESLRRLRTGSLFAIWLVLHAVGRIVMESFRADPRGPEPLGLSISTWISLAVLAAASLWLARVSRLRTKSAA